MSKLNLELFCNKANSSIVGMEWYCSVFKLFIQLVSLLACSVIVQIKLALSTWLVIFYYLIKCSLSVICQYKYSGNVKLIGLGAFVDR